jgi:hypothetical protein
VNSCENFGLFPSSKYTNGLSSRFYLLPSDPAANYYDYYETLPSTPYKFINTPYLDYNEGYSFAVDELIVREGYLLPSMDGNYTLRYQVDDGVRIHLNGELIINSWQPQGETPYYATVTLFANYSYPLKIVYFNGGGQSSSIFSWMVPGSNSYQVIPQSAFLTLSSCICFPATYGPNCEYGTLNSCTNDDGYGITWPTTAPGANVTEPCTELFGFEGNATRYCNGTFSVVEGCVVESPCQNGGSLMMNTSISTVCLCPWGYSGAYCNETEVISGTCQNLGTPNNKRLVPGLMGFALIQKKCLEKKKYFFNRSYYLNLYNDWDYSYPLPALPQYVVLGNPNLAENLAKYLEIVWVGYLVPFVTGLHYFSIEMNTGALVFLSNQQIGGYWYSYGNTYYFQAFLIAQVIYPIHIRYFDYDETASIQLSWQYPGEYSYTTIPSSVFFADAYCNCPFGTSGFFCENGTILPCQEIEENNAYWPQTHLDTSVTGLCNLGYSGSVSRYCHANGTFGPINGTCTSTSSFNPITCLHGGTMELISTSSMVCLCPVGYSGDRCQNLVTVSYCQNFGTPNSLRLNYGEITGIYFYDLDYTLPPPTENVNPKFNYDLYQGYSQLGYVLQYEGYILAPKDGVYAFQVSMKGGIQLTFSGEMFINEWKPPNFDEFF